MRSAVLDSLRTCADAPLSRLLVFVGLALVLSAVGAAPALADETGTPVPSVPETVAPAPLPKVRMSVATVVRRGEPLPVSVGIGALDAPSSRVARVEFQRWDRASRAWKAGGARAVTLTRAGTLGRGTIRVLLRRQGPWRVRASYVRSEGAARVSAPWQSVMVCGDKVIALTFDDGPDRRDTPVALAALRAHRARATFFMMGTRAARNPAIVRQMHADGHQLGNHTWDHINAATQSSVDFKTSVVRTNTRIMSILQGTSRTAPSMRYPLAFRYPWGSGDARTEAVLRSLGMRSSGWTYATGDGGSHGPLSPYVTNLIATKVIDNAAPNAVILMHDGRDRPNTVAALPRILDTLSARGYVFVTVEDMRRLR